MTQQLDRSASHRLAEVLRTNISRACPPGSRTPSWRRQLRDPCEIALNTAQAAIRIFATADLEGIRSTRGTAVRDHTCDRGRQTLRAGLTDLRATQRQSKEHHEAVGSRVAVLLFPLRSEDGFR